MWKINFTIRDTADSKQVNPLGTGGQTSKWSFPFRIKVMVPWMYSWKYFQPSYREERKEERHLKRKPFFLSKQYFSFERLFFSIAFWREAFQPQLLSSWINCRSMVQQKYDWLSTKPFLALSLSLLLSLALSHFLFIDSFQTLIVFYNRYFQTSI